VAVNLTDYANTAAQRGWGQGWPSCSGVKSAGTSIITADRSGTRLSVHKRIARLVDILIDWTESTGYLLKPGQCGGYNCRAIGGTRSPSNHSWGLAVDLNWLDNTFNSTGRHALPVSVARMWNRYGFAWGGDYSGPMKDWMHLEFMGTPDDADVMTGLAISDFARGVAAPAPAPRPTPVLRPSPVPRLRLPASPREDDLMSDLPIVVRPDGRFSRTVLVEAGTSSVVIARAWLVFGTAWGGTHFRVCCLDANGAVMGAAAEMNVDLANNHRAHLEVPSGAVLATIEGHVLSTASQPAAALITLPKTPAA
jgi:hypothetical protein